MRTLFCSGCKHINRMQVTKSRTDLYCKNSSDHVLVSWACYQAVQSEFQEVDCTGRFVNLQLQISGMYITIVNGCVRYL